MAESYISKLENGLAVRIPDAIARQWGVHEGSAIEVIPQGEQLILSKKPYDLDSLLSQITPENLHAEQDFGAPRGREEW